MPSTSRTTTTPTNATNRHIRRTPLRVVATGLCGLTAVLTGCTSTELGHAIPAHAPGPVTPGPEQHHPTLALGDLDPPPSQDSVGAPFDPCTILTWADFPQAVRNPKQTVPTRNKIKPDDQFSIRCTYDYTGGTILIPTSGKAPSTSTLRYFFSQVVWAAPDKLPRKQSEYPHTTAHFYNGVPGWYRRSTTKEGKTCTGWLPLNHGLAAVNTLNGRFPQVDACAVTDMLLTAIANRVG